MQIWEGTGGLHEVATLRLWTVRGKTELVKWRSDCFFCAGIRLSGEGHEIPQTMGQSWVGVC